MPGALWYPPASKVQRKDQFSGITMKFISKVVLHSTESAGWPGYPTFSPTLTYDPWEHEWRQHFPLNRSATTLADSSSTAVRENRDDVVQVEIVGYCDPDRRRLGKDVEQMDDRALKDLGEFIAFLHAEWQLPVVSPVSWVSYPRSYGRKAAQRLSGAAYDSARGVLGHQHVSSNDHGDPGRINIARILAYAKTALAPVPKPPAVVKPAPTVDPNPTPAPKPANSAKHTERMHAWGFVDPREFQCWLWNQPISACDGIFGPKEQAFLDTEDDAKYGTAILKGYPVNYPYGAGNVAGVSAYVLGYHAGDDHAAKAEVAVHTPRSGRVAKVGNDPSGWGNYIEIDYVSSDRRARFCHLASTSVITGQTVTFNQVIGVVGATGNVTGIHCHYQEEVAPYWQGSGTVGAKKRAVREPFYNRSPLADYEKA